MKSIIFIIILVYRWEYGWNYMRGYKPLTLAEKKIIKQKQIIKP